MLTRVRQNIKWIITTILTILMISITIISIVYQNKKLREPYITPKDYQLEIVDKTETPVRKITSEGSVPNKTIPHEEIKRIVLSIKFNNSGRSPGLLKVNKISSSFGDFKWGDKDLLIPALSDSDWKLGLNITEIHNKSNSIVKFNYDLEVYSDKINFHEPLKFSLECDFKFRKYNDNLFTTNPNCIFLK